MAPIPLAIAENDRVAGHDQCFAAGGRGARHDRLGHGAILEHVELHPMAAAGTFGDGFELQRRDGALDEGNAEGGGGAPERKIAPMGEEAVRPGRREGDRQR